jgi:hypothetical protein
MRTERFFYITTLPAIGELGNAPPMKLADLMDHVEDRKKWWELVGALILLDDLKQREALLAGEVDEVEPAVLTAAQASGDSPLPDYLVTGEEREQTPTIETDTLWADYFHWATEVGHRHGSRFLVDWVGFEVALRNALAAARARRLELEERGYLIATDLATDEADLEPVVREWEAAQNPLDGLRVIMRAQWAWIDQHESWYSFDADELLVYAARIMLLEQWGRVKSEE